VKAQLSYYTTKVRGHAIELLLEACLRSKVNTQETFQFSKIDQAAVCYLGGCKLHDLQLLLRPSL